MPRPLVPTGVSRPPSRPTGLKAEVDERRELVDAMERNPTMGDDDVGWIGLGAALGIGLLIGIERERHKGDGPRRSPAGVRTFAIVAMLGAAGYLVGGAWGVALAVAVTAAFVFGAYMRHPSDDPGLTTEFAAVLTCALGGLAQGAPALAGAIGVSTAALLLAREWLHDLIRDRLGEQELTDAVMLAGAALVILPLLPDRAIDLFGVFNPRVIWKLAVVVMLINAAGYVLVRVLGPAAGLPLAGLAGGFVSSAATIGSMASQAKQIPQLRRAAVAGATLSSVATVVQLAVVVGITNESLLVLLWPPLLGAGVVAIAYGAAFSIKAFRKQESVQERPGRAFQPRTALAFAATVTGVLFFSALLEYQFGTTGGIVGVAVAGLADAHSSSISAAALASSGSVDARTAVFAIMLAFSTNTATKIAVAWVTGGPRFALRVSPGLLLMLGAAWLSAWIGERFSP